MKEKKSTTFPGGKRWIRQFRLWLKWGAAILVIGLVADVLYALLTLPPLPAGGLNPDQPSIVYAMDGTPVGQLTDIFRIPVDLSEVPPYLAQAYVASEDIRFYQHPGIDLIGIGRALVTNLLAGEIQEGGSTITQQVARMSFLSTKQTLNRKIQEAVLALLLERHYTKDEILSMYLNQIYLGQGAYGVGAGARLYFDKEAADLTLGEAAMLAGITPSPENYNPLLRPEVGVRQRNIVLDRMVEAGYLTAEEAEAEKAKPLEISRGQIETEQPFPWYMDAVRRELQTRYRLDARMIDLMGLKIYTGLDPTLQAAAEQALEARVFPTSAPDGLEGAFVALDPRTGQVRAVVGSRNGQAVGGFNRALDGKISPGSVLKPLMVYAPAFEYAGLTPESIVEDKPLNINGWQPANWDGQFRGEVTVREAARLSLNSPAIQMLEMVGIQRAKQMAERLGIPFAEGDDSLTLALGAMAEGVSPLQLAAAYQAFANGGFYREPYLITRVEAADGVLQPTDLTVRRAMKSETAYQVTDILKTVVQSGTATGAQIGRPAAGKTGTVELPPNLELEGIEGNSAAWFVGYTPELVGVVWLGYDQIDAEHYLPSSVNGSTYPTAIWRKAVGAALAGQPVLDFPGPQGGAPQVVEAPAPKPAAPEPQPPELVKVVGLTVLPGIRPDEVVLSWTENRPGGAQEAVGYRVFRSAAADTPLEQAEVLATVQEAGFTDRPPAGGTYFYRVAMVDLATQQLGPVSDPVGLTIPELGDQNGGEIPNEEDEGPGDEEPLPGGADEESPGDEGGEGPGREEEAPRGRE